MSPRPRNQTSQSVDRRSSQIERVNGVEGARDLAALERLLRSIDHQGYGAYNRIAGEWRGDGFSLFVDRVQRDQFAAPSKLCIRIPQTIHRIPNELW
jgi:hypothetical protein